MKPIGTRVKVVSEPKPGHLGQIVGYDGISPKIECDDGDIVWGYQVWWHEIKDEETQEGGEA